MATPLTDSINALTQYANETTGKQDTTLSDAVGSLVEGYSQSEPKWKDFSGGNIQAIIGDGNSYINTGLNITENGIFSAKFKPNQAVGYEYVYGTNLSTNTARKINLQRSLSRDVWGMALYPLSTKTEDVDGITIMHRGTINSSDTIYDLPLLLFRGYHLGKMESQTSKITFYGMNITDENNEYVLKIVPWKDENDVVCVRNLVTGENYYNAGTGTFGYIDLDGIKHI